MLQLAIMTDNLELPPEPPRNPATQRAFRRQVWLEIYLPFLGVFVLLAGVATILWTSGSGTASSWADASLILLLLPVIVLSLIPIALSIAIIYGVTYLMKQIPAPANQAQQSIAHYSRIIQKAANQAAQPMVWSKASLAALRRGVQQLGSIFRSDV